MNKIFHPNIDEGFVYSIPLTPVAVSSAWRHLGPGLSAWTLSTRRGLHSTVSIPARLTSVEKAACFQTWPTSSSLSCRSCSPTPTRPTRWTATRPRSTCTNRTTSSASAEVRSRLQFPAPSDARCKKCFASFCRVRAKVRKRGGAQALLPQERRVRRGRGRAARLHVGLGEHHVRLLGRRQPAQRHGALATRPSVFCACSRGSSLENFPISAKVLQKIYDPSRGAVSAYIVFWFNAEAWRPQAGVGVLIRNINVFLSTLYCANISLVLAAAWFCIL